MPNVTQAAYGVNTGALSVPQPVYEPRDPTQYDVQYPLFKQWFNSTTKVLWTLTSFNSSSGTVLASWQQEGGDVQFLTGNSGGEVGPSNTGNVNILGDGVSVNVVGSPSTNTLTISLAGGGTAVDSFTPDSGTSPVVPTAAGLVTIQGGSGSTPNQGITIVGGTNSLSVQTTFAKNTGSELDLYFPGSSNTALALVNSGNVSVPVGDFTVSRANSGGNVAINCLNTSNTSNSTSSLNLSVGGASAGSSYVQYSVSGGVNWSQGVVGGDSNFYLASRTGVAGDIKMSVTTGGLVTIPAGDLSVSRSNIGSSVTSTIANTDNTNAGSAAVSRIVSGGTSGGSAYQVFTVTGSDSWTHGINRGSSNVYQIAASNGALGTNTAFQITQTGYISSPTQPMFDAYMTSSQSNVTGTNELVTVIFNDVSAANRGTVYNPATGVFTAPVSGYYFFSASVVLSGLTANHTQGVLRFNRSGSYSPYSFQGNFGAMRAADNTLILNISGTTFLAATNTFYVECRISSTNKTVTFTADPSTRFWGGLLIF